MTDPDDDDLGTPPDAHRKRAVLHQVATYRELCRRVARSGRHSLVFGGFMLGFWYLQFGNEPLRWNVQTAFSLLYLATAALEFGVGLVNRFFPSAEGVLFDGLVLVLFGASTLARQYLIGQGQVRGAGGVSWVFVAFGAVWVYQGVGHVRGYAALRRLFAERPTAAHLRWFEDLLREVRSADPEADPQALDLPTKPRVRGKLLGDTAILLVGGPDGLVIADRAAVDIEPEPDPDDDRSRLPAARLSVDGQPLGRFRLDPENWRNYAAWKAEGEEPPVVRSAR